MGIQLCQVILPRAKTLQMELPEAVKVATEHTTATGHEAGFLYDPQTHKLKSPIFAGDDCKIEIGYAHKQYGGEGTGEFHTHALSPSVLQRYRDVLQRSPCYFSPRDFRGSARGNIQEISLACPASNDLLFAETPGDIFRGKHAALYSLLEETLRASMHLEGLPQGTYPSKQDAEKTLAALDTIAKELNQRHLALDAFIGGTVK